MVVMGRTFSDHETMSILVVATIVVVFLTSVGSLLISALLVGLAVVCTNGAFRLPEDLFYDEQEPMNSGFLSFLGTAASSAAAAAAAAPTVRACRLDLMNGIESKRFDLYFRRNHFRGEYTVFAGLEECIKLIANFRFTEDEIAFIQSSLPPT